MKFTKEEIVVVEAAAEAREELAILELTSLELAFVGGGSGEISPY